MPPADASLAARKRIMFIKGEDFNFLAYSILIALDELQCESDTRRFRDIRKLAFLIDLQGSPFLAPMLVRRDRLGSSLSSRDTHMLSNAYANGVARRHLVSRVVNAMARRGFITAVTNPETFECDIFIVKAVTPIALLASDLFTQERTNLRLLLSLSSRLRSLTLPTFLDRFFTDHGVQTWHS